MHKTSWRLQDAEARFAAVVDAALAGEAQLVTRHGNRAVVVLDAHEYERLCQGERRQAPGFIGHLLSIPRGRREAAHRPRVRLRDRVFE